MPKIKILFLFLPFVLMACTLTAQVTPQPLQQPKATIHAQIITQVHTLNVCQVKTGFAKGRLNVRSCGGLACPVLAVIGEGEILNPTQTINGWLEVQAGSLHGWVNSNYCEVKK